MIKDLYPFSTADGKVIPLDILRPLGVLKKDFDFTTGTSLESVGVTVPIMLLRSSKNCYVRFGTVAVLPTSGGGVVAETVYVPRGEIIVCAPKDPNYSVLGETEVGTLFIQLMEQWAGLGNEAQYAAI